MMAGRSNLFDYLQLNSAYTLSNNQSIKIIIPAFFPLYRFTHVIIIMSCRKKNEKAKKKKEGNGFIILIFFSSPNFLPHKPFF